MALYDQAFVYIEGQLLIQDATAECFGRRRKIPGGDARPSFDSIWIGLAYDFRDRSTCARLKVGCAIVSDDNQHVYGIGYNGNAKGFPNRCDSDELGACGCLHAEDNATTKCRAPHGADLVVYCTHNPCVMCAKRLVNLGGVRRVIYAEAYRSDAGLVVLEQAGIHCDRFYVGGPRNGSEPQGVPNPTPGDQNAPKGP